MSLSLRSFRALALVSLATCSACRSPIPTQSAYVDDSIFVVGAGVRQWNSDWNPVDEPLTLQFGYMYEPEVWPVGIEAGVTWATEDETLEGSGLSSDTYEASMGATKTFWPVKDRLLITLGAGLAVSYTRDRLDVFAPGGSTSTSGSDVWPGAYFHTRFAWKFSKVFDVGVDVRALTGPDAVSVIGPVRSGDYVQATLGLGIHQ